VTFSIAASGQSTGESLIFVCGHWLDLTTNILVSVPVLLLADWALGSWLLFLAVHVAASTPYFMATLGYSLPFAMFKVRVKRGP